VYSKVEEKREEKKRRRCKNRREGSVPSHLRKQECHSNRGGGGKSFFGWPLGTGEAFSEERGNLRGKFVCLPSQREYQEDCLEKGLSRDWACFRKGKQIGLMRWLMPGCAQGGE